MQRNAVNDLIHCVNNTAGRIICFRIYLFNLKFKLTDETKNVTAANVNLINLPQTRFD